MTQMNGLVLRTVLNQHIQPIEYVNVMIGRRRLQTNVPEHAEVVSVHNRGIVCSRNSTPLTPEIESKVFELPRERNVAEKRL